MHSRLARKKILGSLNSSTWMLKFLILGLVAVNSAVWTLLVQRWNQVILDVRSSTVYFKCFIVWRVYLAGSRSDSWVSDDLNLSIKRISLFWTVSSNVSAVGAVAPQTWQQCSNTSHIFVLFKVTQFKSFPHPQLHLQHDYGDRQTNESPRNLGIYFEKRFTCSLIYRDHDCVFVH